MPLSEHRFIKWILVNRVPVPCDDLIKWGEFMSTPESIVAQTDIDEDVRVSTVFLGIDHSFSMDPEAMAVLFETMVFGEENTFYWKGKPHVYRETSGQRRYCTWAEAEEGHREMCEIMRQRLGKALEVAMKSVGEKE